MVGEPVHVHVREIERWLARHDPLRHDLADAACPCDAVRTEAGSDEQPGHFGLPETELVVRSECLGAVDHAAHPEVAEHGHPGLGVGRDLLEPGPVLA